VNRVLERAGCWLGVEAGELEARCADDADQREDRGESSDGDDERTTEPDRPRPPGPVTPEMQESNKCEHAHQGVVSERFVALGYGFTMAEVVEVSDLTVASQNGWALDYRIRRDDGEELHAEVRCWEKAQSVAEQAANTDALAAIADRGSTAVLEYAELVDSPATRGAVLISIWFDPADDGNLRRRVSYER
jgi:hypothetical protein